MPETQPADVRRRSKRYRLAVTFTGLDGREHRYLEHPYNAARTNERAVEVPVALDWISHRRGRGLEVGNVLRHYVNGGARWDCVDRYEVGAGVTNVDILSFTPGRVYDWIVTISTVEHIGWDGDEERDVDKSPAAIDYMRRHLLRPDGVMLVSFPTGVHPRLDSGELAEWATSSVYLMRVDEPTERCAGSWEPRPFTAAPYLSEAWSAGGVWVGELPAIP